MKPSETAAPPETITSYKGFDKDLACAPAGNRFQYEIGGEFVECAE